MTVLVLGISHRSAPLAALDALSLDAAGADDLAQRALDGEFVTGVCVLATCNRLEIIADVSGFHGGLTDLGSALVTVTGQEWAEISHHLYVHYDDAAVEHLLTLAAGLDSMAVGESQILGQLRGAFSTAQEAGRLTGALSGTLQDALRVGKRAHAETALDSVAGSLLDASLGHAVEHIGPLKAARALVVGAGAMSGLVVAGLARAGVTQITVLNRTLERAERLAEAVSGRARVLTDDALAEELSRADLVVSVTGARGQVITPRVVDEALALEGAPEPAHTFIVDLALPYDVAPEVGEYAHIRVLGLDDLAAHFADAGSAQTADVIEILSAVRAIIRAELEEIGAEKRARAISPTVAALRRQVEEIVSAEFGRLRGKLPADLDDVVLAEIRKSMRRLGDKLIHTPTVRVKELAASHDVDIDYAAALTTLFDLQRTPAAIETTLASHSGRASAAEVSPVPAPRSNHIQTDGHTPVADHTLDVVEPETFSGRTVRLGTRRSMLARSQSTAIAQQLAAQFGWRVEIVEVVTEGDVNMTPLATFGGTGVFVSAVRTALLTGQIDLAVHSLKDLPTAAAPGIALAAVPPRVDPSDVLIARDGLALADLPAGAVIGTGSPRRAAQLRAARPDVEVTGVRGNVDTRIRHVTEGRLDAVVLAAAGVRRLGRLAEVSDVLDSSVMLPAPGQGALAIECRAAGAESAPGDEELRRSIQSINDEATALAVVAERAVLSRAEAGCSAPIGTLASLDGRSLELTAVMADDAGRLLRVTDRTELPRRSEGTSDAEIRHTAKELGSRVADSLLSGLGIELTPEAKHTAESNAPQTNLAADAAPDDRTPAAETASASGGTTAGEPASAAAHNPTAHSAHEKETAEDA